MALEKYREKRKFSKTLEPRGDDSPSPRGERDGGEGEKDKLHFVVQEHHARNLHYDLRLEMGGVLKSWAVPKGVPEKPDEKRLAIMVEDHPLEYGNFEGTIPEGEYGAGTVKIWDRGTYEMAEATEKAYKFILRGKRLKGQYVLFNFKNDKNWLLFKTKKST